MSARADRRSRGRLGVGRGLRRPPPSFPPAVRTFIVQVGSSEVQRDVRGTPHTASSTCPGATGARILRKTRRAGTPRLWRPRKRTRRGVAPASGKLKESRHRKQKLLISQEHGHRWARAWSALSGPKDAQAPATLKMRLNDARPVVCPPGLMDRIGSTRVGARGAPSRSGGTSGSAKHRKSGGCRALLSSSVSRRSR